jgi:hypothetical protein
MNCQFCCKEVKNNNAKSQHELYCSENPNKKTKIPSYGMLGKSGSNQYIKGTANPLSEETRRTLAENAKNKIWDTEARAKHSIAMKEAVAKYPESYTSSNRGRTKQIIHDGIRFQGKWELDFYLFCKTNNIKIVRSTEWFEYEWEGIRKYFPDFYLPDMESYVEVKGYETEKDRAKWSNFPKKLIIIRKLDIMNIRKGTFQL